MIEGVPHVSSRERAALLSVVWCACVVFLCATTIADPDLWGHTLYGLRAAERGLLVERQDPFSYTAPGAGWINHEWLSEYQYGRLWRSMGNTGLVLWRNGLVLIVFLAVAAAFRQARVGIAAGILLLVFSTECLSNFFVFVRPQVATFALFAMFLTILRRQWDRPQSHAIWWLPPLMALWVNLHGGFLAGLGITGLFAAASVWKWIRGGESAGALRLMLITALCTLATLVNPYGFRLHQMLWHHLWTPQFVREWQPLWAMDFSPIHVVPFLLTLLALKGRTRWTLPDALILAVTAWQATMHVRHVALFAIACLILLPGPITAAIDALFSELTFRWSRPRLRWLRVGATSAIIGFMLAIQCRTSLQMWRDGISPWEIAVETRSDVPGMPVRAVSAVKSMSLSGNLVTDYGWGQFAIWHLYPESRVAFDGRYRTVFPAELEREFLDFQTAQPGSHPITPILDAYPTEIALLPVGDSPDRYLMSRGDWRCVYRDEQAAVYCRLSAAGVRTATAIPAIPRWVAFPASPVTGTAVAEGMATPSVARDIARYPSSPR